MKKIEAIIKRANFPAIATELDRMGYSVIDRRNLDDSSFSESKKETKGSSPSFKAVPLSKIELVVSDKDARKVVNLISTKSGLSSNPSGKIFISEMTEVVHMKTMVGEKDLEDTESLFAKNSVSKRSRLVPLQKNTLLKLEKIYEENIESLQTDYRIKSFSDFVNHCIMGYLPTLEKQLNHPSMIYEDGFGKY